MWVVVKSFGKDYDFDVVEDVFGLFDNEDEAKKFILNKWIEVDGCNYVVKELKIPV